MTSAMSAQQSGRFGLTNKTIGIGVAVFSLIEAIVSYFFVFAPLYINPVFQKCDDYNAQGMTCTVKLFGKLFASNAEKEEYQIILSLSDTILNMAIIYLIFTGIALLLAFCMFKGLSFAKTYLIAVFGAKHIVGLAALLIPFANMRRSIMIFGVVDAIICLAFCLFFILINNDEYIDDMLLTDDQVTAMNKRMKFGFVLYGIFMVLIVATKFAMYAYGANWSLFLGWTNDTALAQGYTIAGLLAIALVAAIMFIREADRAMYFYAAFGGAMTIANLLAVVKRILWIFNTYMPTKALRNQGDQAAIDWFAAGNGMTTAWWIATIFLIVAFVASAVVALLAFNKIKSKLSFKFTADDAKPAKAVLISAGTIVLSFILTIAAYTLWHREMYAGYPIGAMDYMYFFVYGGATLFLALAMMGGYSFTKFGTLGMYLLVISNNFINIFNVFGERAARVAATEGYVGYNYIITAVLLIVSLVACAGILFVFIIKGVNDYMYEKRYS